MWHSFLRRSLGQYRRQKGLYDKVTLACFSAAWADGRSPVDLLHYALFRRDLGRPLPVRWVGLMAAALPDFSPVQRRMALGLLAEVRPDVLSAIDPAMLSDGRQLPAVASRMHSADDLARIDECQPAWREAFADRCRSAVLSGGLAVIGNGATLNGLGVGSRIDQHSLVVRFNHFMGGGTLAEDVGERTDVWVLSPGYEGPVPDGVSWVVMSGPDMRYRLSDWHQLMPLLKQGVPLLTVPLAVWRQLTCLLQSPPSAGVLFLAHLNSLIGGHWQRVSIAGIGSGLAKNGRYHASLPRHLASERHAWDKEAKLVQAWRQNGLSAVTTENRGAP
ncbi:MAG: glycosyltransferase family 29 protein [Azonexus sp.]